MNILPKWIYLWPYNLININYIQRLVQLLDFSVLLRIQMKTQIVRSFAFEIAQVTSESGFFAAFVFQMSSDVALELVTLEASHATIDSIVLDVVRFCICNSTIKYWEQYENMNPAPVPEKSQLRNIRKKPVTNTKLTKILLLN